MTGGRPWFCLVHESEWKTGTAEIDQMVEHDMSLGGDIGDRRQELVFIGEALDIKGIEAVLDECLLTEKEWAGCRKIMLEGSNEPFKVCEAAVEGLSDRFDDGFPDWPEEAEGHEGHDHA